MNSDDVDLVLRKKAFIYRNECALNIMERPLAYVANMMWWTSFQQNSFNGVSTSSSSSTGNRYEMCWSKRSCHRTVFYECEFVTEIHSSGCKKDLMRAMLITSLHTNGFGVHFHTSWDLIQQVAILEHWKTFERSKQRRHFCCVHLRKQVGLSLLVALLYYFSVL